MIPAITCAQRRRASNSSFQDTERAYYRSVRVIVLALVVGCSHEDPVPPAPPPEKPVAAPPVQKLSTDFGSCELDGEKIVPDKKPVVTKYWSPDETMALSVNCIGKTGRLSFSASPNATVPFGPKTYKLDAGRGDLVVYARAKDKQLTAMTGSVEVTAFDAHHLAGTFDLTANKVTLAGSFDFSSGK